LVLNSYIEFLTAALTQRKVSVRQDDTLYEENGMIEKITDTAVKIYGAYYFRTVCEIRVVKG
jgi:hypothetical protein